MCSYEIDFKNLSQTKSPFHIKGIGFVVAFVLVLHTISVSNNSAMRFANHNVAAAAAIMLSMKAGLDPELVYDLLSTSAVTSRMFEVRGPMMVAMTMTELA